MKYFLKNVLMLLFVSFSLAVYSQGTNIFNQQTDALLSKYVEKGNVDYSSLKSNFTEIDQLYKSLKDIKINGASDNEKKAFYINAYNIIVIHQITKHFPLKSALDRSGFFDKVKHEVAGESLTLDQIEKGKVILTYRDPRVHFAFSCAAVGCPELGSFAYFPNKLEEQLEQRTKNALNNPEFIKVDNKNKTVGLSMIFKWYDKEFKDESGSVLAYINKYRTNKIPANYTIDFYPYDWALNIQ